MANREWTSDRWNEAVDAQLQIVTSSRSSYECKTLSCLWSKDVFTHTLNEPSQGEVDKFLRNYLCYDGVNRRRALSAEKLFYIA